MAIATPALMRAVFLHHLERLDALLATAAEHTAEDEAILAARLTATPAPSFADDEDSIASLRGRIAATLRFLAATDEAAYAGAERRRVTFAFGGRPVEADGANFLLGFAVPNCLFHTSITYAILRSLGVPLGKCDFLGSPQGLEGL